MTNGTERREYAVVDINSCMKHTLRPKVTAANLQSYRAPSVKRSYILYGVTARPDYFSRQPCRVRSESDSLIRFHAIISQLVKLYNNVTCVFVYSYIVMAR